MIVQSGNLVITCCGIPAKKLVRSGLADEFLASKPINFTHIGIDFRSQWNCLRRSDDNLFIGRRNNSRAMSGSARQFAANIRQKRRRNFSRNTGLLEEREKFAGQEFVNLASQFPCAVIDRNAQTAPAVDQDLAMHL